MLLLNITAKLNTRKTRGEKSLTLQWKTVVFIQKDFCLHDLKISSKSLYIFLFLAGKNCILDNSTRVEIVSGFFWIKTPLISSKIYPGTTVGITSGTNSVKYKICGREKKKRNSRWMCSQEVFFPHDALSFYFFCTKFLCLYTIQYILQSVCLEGGWNIHARPFYHIH